MGIKHLREDEKGSGLVLTLMVLLVLSVLGVSIGTLTLGSYRLSAANRDDTSAYYVAEAAAVAAYDEIQRSVLNAYESNATEGSFYNQVSSIVTSKNGQSAVAFGEQFGTEPTATIRTEKASGTDPQIYTIYSTGNVDGKERTVTKQITVEWFEKNTGGGGLPMLPDDAALLTQGKVEISNGTLQGDIYTNSVEPKSFIISGNPTFSLATLFHSNNITTDELLDYPSWYGAQNKLPNLEPRDEEWDFGAYPELLNQVSAPNLTEKLPVKKIGTHMVQDENGNLNITNSQAKDYELKLESDVYIPKIVSNSNRSFTINTGGADRTILVDTLEVGGDIHLSGAGKLTIVVKNAFTIKTGGISINESGTPSKLTLVYLGNSALDLENIKQISGHMIVKSAGVEAKNTSIKGVFLTGGSSVALSGGNADSKMMLIAPNAAVSLAGSYSINGTVIAKTFKMEGGTSLKYADVATTGFPFGSTEVVADPKPEDIISAGAIIEK